MSPIVEVILSFGDLLITSWRPWLGLVVGSLVGFVVWGVFVPTLSEITVVLVCMAIGFIAGVLWARIAETRGEDI